MQIENYQVKNLSLFSDFSSCILLHLLRLGSLYCQRSQLSERWHSDSSILFGFRHNSSMQWPVNLDYRIDCCAWNNCLRNDEEKHKDLRSFKLRTLRNLYNHNNSCGNWHFALLYKFFASWLILRR